MAGISAMFFYCLIALTLLIWSIYFPSLVWKASPVFFYLNKVQWWAHNPIRPWLKNNRNSRARLIFLLSLPFLILWGVMVYFLLFPVRILNSLYFNILLFFSLNLRDRLADLFQPKIHGLRHLKGKRYLVKWIISFPNRMWAFFLKFTLAVLQSIAMFLFDLVWPSLTLFHGTSFQTASLPITQSGKWRVGREDFVGTGIYFAIDPKVAAHYSGVMQPSVIVARVTLTYLRPVATLSKKIRTRAGAGGNGDLISTNAGFLTGALEHWRHDRGGWYEFCLVYPNKKGKYVRSWRIRPICILPLNKVKGKTGNPERIWSGTAFWPLGKAAVLLMFLTLFTILTGIIITLNFNQIFPKISQWF